jgi:hypothetical protein
VAIRFNAVQGKVTWPGRVVHLFCACTQRRGDQRCFLHNQYLHLPRIPVDPLVISRAVLAAGGTGYSGRRACVRAIDLELKKQGVHKHVLDKDRLNTSWVGRRNLGRPLTGIRRIRTVTLRSSSSCGGYCDICRARAMPSSDLGRFWEGGLRWWSFWFSSRSQGGVLFWFLLKGSGFILVFYPG